MAHGGRKEEAEAALRRLVGEGLRLPRAYAALGVLCGERGERGERRLWLERARQLENDSGEPPSLRLLLNLLIDALEHGEPERALAFGHEALTHYPEDGEAHMHQVEAARALGRFEEAQSHLERARALFHGEIERDPTAVATWRRLAQLERMAERPGAAIESYGRALELDPNHVPTLLGISRLLVNQGSMEEAMLWLMNALAVAPGDPEVLCRNGIALKAIGEQEQAIALLRQALAIQPALVDASIYLASCLTDRGELEEAATVYRQALVKTPGDRNCRLGLANTLRFTGDIAGSLALHRQLLEEMPDDIGAFSNWMFTASISTVVPPAEVLDTAARFWAHLGVDGDAARVIQPAHPKAAGRPLRVGLLSADIGNHVVGRFLDPLLRHHDPSRCQLELVSMRRLYDASSEELASLADGVESLEGLPDGEARARLRQREYDLIVDTSGYTGGSGLHLLAERCAPLQAHYIGYHATTGLATIDAFIGDGETASADLQSQFSERLWRLPRPWLAFPKEQVFPEATPLMQTDRPVIGSFCQVTKITDATVEIWAEVMKRVPEAVLMLKNNGLQDASLRKCLEERFLARGVKPGRLTFHAPVSLWWDHVDHYNVLDIALDTTPWSSATTGFEALAMGVPLVAIRGNTMASRMSSSLVKGLGRPEWIGDSPQSVANIIAFLCTDLPTLRKTKGTRQQEAFASSLFDSVGYAEGVIELFTAIVGGSSREFAAQESKCGAPTIPAMT
ncbi:MAG: tetratricopeptide repeat protein [Cyanobacteriota bacterium]|nr:tetratricopeptide repeat protein [Cyanobacteriota bacterium]